MAGNLRKQGKNLLPRREKAGTGLPEPGAPLRTGCISRWGWVLLELGLTAAAAAVLAAGYLLGRRFGLPVGFLPPVVGGVWAAGSVYLPFFCRSCRFTLGEGYVEFTSGILFQMRRRLSVRAVTAVSELIAPFSSLTATRSLYISAMGGGMLLPMLRKKDAEALEGYLLSRMGRDGNG